MYKTQARQDALQQVAEKAQALSQALGVKLVGIVSYDEYEGGTGSMPKYAYAESMAMGGGMAPDVSVGSDDVVMNVSVTFEIR